MPHVSYIRRLSLTFNRKLYGYAQSAMFSSVRRPFAVAAMGRTSFCRVSMPLTQGEICVRTHKVHNHLITRSSVPVRCGSFKATEVKMNMSAKTLLHSHLTLWLRDICACPQCIDVSTGQKLFQTCDIDTKIEAGILEETEDTFKLAWKNDVRGYGPDHVSMYFKDTLLPLLDPPETSFGCFAIETPNEKIQLWDRNTVQEQMNPFLYDAYLASDTVLREVLVCLKTYGLVILKEVPRVEDAVERIASRIGHLRETFYGRTWDVKSVPQAKNVAYTNQSLGFHMDLLYMRDPPGLQLLHCLENSCKGGTSMFADGFRAASIVKGLEKDHFEALTSFPQLFRYRNSGQHYRFKRPLIQLNSANDIESVNWSPPFQGPFEQAHLFSSKLKGYVRAARYFASIIEAPENMFEYRMESGDCVIFNNRRILHARRAFDTTSGERWLKGAYIDTDVFNSRCRGLFR